MSTKNLVTYEASSTPHYNGNHLTQVPRK